MIRNFFGDAKYASLLTSSHKTSVLQYYNLVADKLALEHQTREAVWGGDLAIDAVLAPVQASPAVPHGGCDRLMPLGCSTLIWNVVDSPVGVIPVTRVDPARDELPSADSVPDRPPASPQAPAEPSVQSGAGLPACLAWSDGCITCERADGKISCSNPGIACQPQAPRCLKTEDK